LNSNNNICRQAMASYQSERRYQELVYAYEQYAGRWRP